MQQPGNKSIHSLEGVDFSPSKELRRDHQPCEKGAYAEAEQLAGQLGHKREACLHREGGGGVTKTFRGGNLCENNKYPSRLPTLAGSCCHTSTDSYHFVGAVAYTQ